MSRKSCDSEDSDRLGSTSINPTKHQHIHEIQMMYSLVHLVRPKMEELISQTLLGLFKIRLLFQDRMRSQNLRN